MKLPKQGLIFWPVGCGDSTTIRVNDKVFIQVDLNHMAQSADEECGAVAVIDELVKILPRNASGRPYLSVFVLTHQDLDHCRGFEELLEKVDIGELWFTPRIFSENKSEPSEEAQIFAAEAIRRVETMIKQTTRGQAVVAGDRVRIIGYSDVLKEEEYQGFPEQKLSIPGTTVTELDGEDLAGSFRAFIHAPFKDDADGERNETSLAFQLKLSSSEGQDGFAMLLGDHAYEVIMRIFTFTKDGEFLKWHVLLAPHHCSKKVMYFRGAGEDEEAFKKDIMDLLEKNQCPNGYVVASCNVFPDSNQSGDNPPHILARNRYQEIVNTAFHSTHEHTGEDCGEPVVFELGAGGFTYLPTDKEKAIAKNTASLASAIAKARGSAETPNQRVGFGESGE